MSPRPRQTSQERNAASASCVWLVRCNATCVPSSRQYQWFWKFEQGGNYVYVIELEKLAEGANQPVSNEPKANRATVVMSAVPINVGPLLWEQLWSRLDTAICTSATLTVYSQGFDFFLRRIGLERERVERRSLPNRLSRVSCPTPLIIMATPCSSCQTISPLRVIVS